MSSVNKVILIGHLGKNPEIRYLENGRARVTFTLATNESYKNKKGEKITHTEWHHIVLWTPLAELAEKYLTKGNQVYIDGKITARSYLDKEDNKKSITEIVGQQLVFLGKNQEEKSKVGENIMTDHIDPVQDKDGMDGLPF